MPNKEYSNISETIPPPLTCDECYKKQFGFQNRTVRDTSRIKHATDYAKQQGEKYEEWCT